MRLFLLTMLLQFSYSYSFAQDLPVKTLKGTDPAKPLIFYVSGDGGWNSFSTGFMEEWNKRGYSVLALNSKSYFWKKKDPKEFSISVENVLRQYLTAWKLRSVVLIGYSFGADVMPFLETRLSPAINENVLQMVLMSPSEKTDFEVHVLGMMGYGKNSGQSVIAEVNKIRKPVLILSGSNENDFPFQLISAKNVVSKKLPGGHHYDGNFAELVNMIQKETKL